MKSILTKTRPLFLAKRNHSMPFTFRGFTKIVTEEETVEIMIKKLEKQMLNK